MTPMAYVEIAVALPVYSTFTYRVQDHFSFLAKPGVRVLVPFSQRKVTGYILRVSDTSDIEEAKFILDVLDEEPVFPSSMIPFFQWVSDYYIHPIGEVIHTALPSGLIRKDISLYAVTEAGKTVAADDSLSSFQKDILSILQKSPKSCKDLARTIGISISKSILLTMEKNGCIERIVELKTETAKRRIERYVSSVFSEIDSEKISPSQKRILETIQSYGEMSVRELNRQIPAASRKLTSMQESGWLNVITKTQYRDPFGETVDTDSPPVLTGEQHEVVSAVENEIGKGFKPFLLKGVTGSGKTEVYMQLAEKVIKNNRSVLVLVPEIALISQTERCFRARFGDLVAILHSGLSKGERFDQWQRILKGQTPVAIGTRSAIFAPFERLGLIVVDEEHDTSYKQDTGLHYNARDISLVRAKMDNAVAILGSATPSVQSYYNVLTKKIHGLTLTSRIEDRQLPETLVIDLRKQRDQRGIWKLITPELFEAMKKTLARGEQVLLFLNRRGFSSFPVCQSCGEAMKCKHCSISMTLHQKEQAYKCHYCGSSRAFSSACPACGSAKIKLLGMGTERIEAAVKSLFPDASIARMDRDTVSQKGALLRILKGLRNRTTDILIGTQMVAKGHDFPHITLVGIICADISFNLPDFRSSERMFQLLLQVSGRAGRGESPGQVILQTYNPEHFVITNATNQDYAAFYEKEILFRKNLKYPPFSRMIQIKIYGRSEEKTSRHAIEIGDFCQSLRKNSPSYNPVEILGPIESYLPKIASHYRWQILLKSLQTEPLRNMTKELIFQHGKKIKNSDVNVVFDVDPVFML